MRLNDWEIRPPVREVDGEAAHEGAEAIKPRVPNLRERAFWTFARAGEKGATNEDLYRDHPDLRPDSIRPRVAELVKVGLIEECGRRRGSYGVSITVWKLTELGRSLAEVDNEKEVGS